MGLSTYPPDADHIAAGDPDFHITIAGMPETGKTALCETWVDCIVVRLRRREHYEELVTSVMKGQPHR